MLHIQRVPLPHPYPWLGVLTFLGVQAVEVGLLALVLRPRSYSSSWRRSLAATVACLSLGVYFGLRLMHAPPYLVFHWLWVLSGLVGCSLLFLFGVYGARRLPAA